VHQNNREQQSNKVFVCPARSKSLTIHAASYEAVLLCGVVYYAVQGGFDLKSVKVRLKCGHSNESYWACRETQSSSPTTSIMLPVRADLDGTKCRRRHAYYKPKTRIVSCKLNLKLACDHRLQHKKCHRIMKHVLKACDSHNHTQC